MKCTPETMRLYAVTDRAWTGRQTLTQQVEAALKGGVTCVQLREKQLDEADILNEAVSIGTVCRHYGVPFLLNDCVELALRCGADGVHVGQEDMACRDARRLLGPDKIVGVSAHSVEEARQALADGADYLGVGAAFVTHTKSDAHALPLSVLTAVCTSVPIPTVAIGGIHRENLPQLKGCGADGVALVSAIFSAEDIEKECHALRAMVEEII